MKNFPDNLVNHAIIVRHFDEWRDLPSEDKKDDILDDDIMFSQLLGLFQNRSIDIRDFYIMGLEAKSPRSSISGKYELMVNKLIDNSSDLYDQEESILLKSISMGGFEGNTQVFKPYYKLIFLSYVGAGQIPWYWQIKGQERSEEEMLRRFRYESPKPNHLNPVELYNDIKSGKKDGKNLFSWRLANRNLVYINTNYSKIWKLLDSGFEDGILWESKLKKTSPLGTYKDIKGLLDNEGREQSDKVIKVAIARSWEALFIEELTQLYSQSKFCQICGNMLPIGRSRKVCPRTTENQNCNRRYDKIRKARQQSKSQNR